MSKDNIILCGFMGCGKTTIGKYLATLTGKKFIDMDAAIEKKARLTISDIFDKYGEEHFRIIETACVDEISKKTGCIIATGGGTVLNYQNVAALRQSGKLFLLDVTFDLAFQRISQCNDRPLVRKLDRIELKNLFDLRRDKYLSCADFIINANTSCAEIAANILHMQKM